MHNITLFLLVSLMASIITMWAYESPEKHGSSFGAPEGSSEDSDLLAKLDGASAHWITPQKLLWQTGTDVDRIELRYSLQADIRITGNGVSGGNVIEVGAETSLGEGLSDRFRHIANRPVYETHVDDETVRNAVKGQLIAIAYDKSGNVLTATRVQFPNLLDEVYSYEGQLGPEYHDDIVKLNLWAPTAQNVKLHLYDADKNHIKVIDPDYAGSDGKNAGFPKDGVWRFTGDRKDWNRRFYKFEITVYHHDNDRVNEFLVTDPYSVSLSTDSYYSQFADLSGDPELRPEGWDQLEKHLPRRTDISLYEAHVRDFSIMDESVAEEHRGTFKAFTYNGRGEQDASVAMTHLERLSKAGLTHIHLLPVNDIATVNENPENRIDLHHPYKRICEYIDHKDLAPYCDHYGDMSIYEVFEELAEEDPATQKIQKPYNRPGRMDGLAAYDGFNWGYDPLLFNVPEGSYASDSEGVTRIIEFREMVKALHEIGLKVVIDVVYNHTFASGTSRFSVLDKVVPGYYHRYNPDTGEMERSTCCENTAAEHAMMEKLIIDSVMLWAREYKVDSFRFDLMGHHPRYVMENLKKALSTLTMEKDGVDGSNIYIYGEGWNFGEVADNRLFDQATQFNLAGTGIGNFNDRIRDAIRGGNFTENLRAQGFTSGLYLFPNDDANPNQDENKRSLIAAADRIRVGMSGNLGTYPYINFIGDKVEGSYENVGFAKQPQESVNYIDKHDNETLWDNTQPKLPLDLDMEERVRVHLLSNAFINFGQGIPFYQMGSDILRSKSMDRNSFDSGDWFNAVDFSLKSHNWGIGLPPAWDNEARWDIMKGFLRNPELEVRKEHMEQAHNVFQEQLQIRYSSPLFRLNTAEEIHRRLAFHNTGPDQQPGIIVMSISDGLCAGENLDPELDGIIVLFNADRKERFLEMPISHFGADRAVLHPVQLQGADQVIRQATLNQEGFVLPPLSAAVFVVPESGEQGDFICNQ